MNRLHKVLQRGQNLQLKSNSLFLKNTYNYRPFQDILEKQILGNVHKFNQDLYLNQTQIDYLSHQIYHIHNNQSLVFLFRLLKLFSLTQDQFDVLNQAQRKKYKDFHEVRQIAEKANFQKQMWDKPTKHRNEKNSNEKEEEGEHSEERHREKNSGKDSYEPDKSTLSELSNIYKMRNELKDVIWTILNLHNNHIENVFLYHIFINKQLNKLISMAFDRETETDYYFFGEAYNSVDRSLVTAEQMCLLVVILSTNQKYENMPNIFEGELAGILSVIQDKEISYSLGRFLIRLGLNHLEDVNREDVQLGSEQSLNFDMIQDSKIFLDQQSASLYLFDLQSNKQGVDVKFFQKFNRDNILKKLRLDQIDELISVLIQMDTSEEQPHQFLVQDIIRQVIENSMGQTENFKVYNDILLDQLKLVIKYNQYGDAKSLTSLLDTIVSEIMNQTSGKVSLTNAFTNYIVDFITITPPNCVDFYPLFDAFFTKQSVERISYTQLIAVYQQMVNTGVDYDEYLHICHQVFQMNKHEILNNQLHLTIIPLAEILHDTATADIFGFNVKPKSQSFPEGIQFLSDFSESDEEGDKKQNQEEQEPK